MSQLPPSLPDRPVAREPFDWMSVAFGVIVGGVGLYFLYNWYAANGNLWSRSGLGLLSAGIASLPWTLTRLVGGLGLLGVGVWLVVIAKYPLDYAYAAIFGILGISALVSVKARRA